MILMFCSQTIQPGSQLTAAHYCGKTSGSISDLSKSYDDCYQVLLYLIFRVTLLVERTFTALKLKSKFELLEIEYLQFNC